MGQGLDIHASCGYVHYLLSLAKALAFLVVAVEGHSEERHVLEENFEGAWKAPSPRMVRQ